MKKLTKRELKKEAASLHADILSKDAARQRAFLAEKFPNTEETAPKESFTHWKPLAIVSAVLILVLTGGAFLVSYFREKTPSSTLLQPKSFAFGYEYETEPIDQGEIINSLDLCAFSAPSDTFDINDVTLDFSFGWHWESIYVEQDRNIPNARIAFNNPAVNNGEYHIIKTFTDYTSEQYRCYLIYNENDRVSRIDFNHTEHLTIPAYLFSEDEGEVFFGVFGDDLNHNFYLNDFLTGIGYYYKVNGSSVTLSLYPFSN